jgi:cell division protein FtsL
MAETPKKEDEETKTFDMYSCFSRVDVILAIVFTVAVLLFAVFYIFTPQPV